MILFAKHLVLMSVALLVMPILGRLFARQVGAKSRMKRPGLSAGFIVSRLIFALAIPLLAQGVFAYLDHRWIALALAGAVYGAVFGHAEDFPVVPGALWGALGGLAAAYAFIFFPPSEEARSFCVSIFAVAPFLAYRPASTFVRSRLASSGLITPTRRVLR